MNRMLNAAVSERILRSFVVGIKHFYSAFQAIKKNDPIIYMIYN